MQVTSERAKAADKVAICANGSEQLAWPYIDHGYVWMQH